MANASRNLFSHTAVFNATRCVEKYLIYLRVFFSNPDFQLVAPGCLGHPDDPVSSSLLNALAVLKHKVIIQLNY
jgi:hypothetical protein